MSLAILLSTFGTAMAQQPAPWPDAATLLTRHSALVRGQFDTAAHQTRYTRQHIEFSPGVTGIIEKFQKKPDELVQKTRELDGSTVLNGFDGHVAWEVRDGIARLVTEPDALVLEGDAAFYDALLSVPMTIPMARNATTLGQVRVGSDTAYAVSAAGFTLASAEAGGLPIVYISKSTGLITSTTVGGGNKPWLVRQTFDGYRDFGGLLIATKVTTTSRTEAASFERSIIIDEVRWDTVSERELELPEAVRALMKP